MKKQNWKLAAAAVFLAVAGFYSGCGRLPAADGGEVKMVLESEAPAAKESSQADHESNPTQTANSTQTGDPENAGNSAAAADVTQTSETAKGFVHICGAVKRPGVYELSLDSRVFEAVEAAGGFADDAADDSLNLAGKIFDGMKLTVLNRTEAAGLTESQLAEKTGQAPDKETAGGSPQKAAGGGLINLNTATKEELMSLSGIGESRAADILRYREEHGDFTKIEDIKRIPGIKDALFLKIKDSITV